MVEVRIVSNTREVDEFWDTEVVSPISRINMQKIKELIWRSGDPKTSKVV